MLENSLKIYLNNIAESYNINQSDNSLSVSLHLETLIKNLFK